jgi:hypothetical protein
MRKSSNICIRRRSTGTSLLIFWTLNAFKQIADSNIDKITLEFGVNISGETGIPYVTKGTVASNMNITVECSFPKKTENTTGVPTV